MDIVRNAAEQGTVALDNLSRLSAEVEELVATEAPSEARSALEGVRTALADAAQAQAQAVVAVALAQPDIDLAKSRLTLATERLSTVKDQLRRVAETGGTQPGVAATASTATAALADAEKAVEATRVATNDADARRHVGRTRLIQGCAIVLLPAIVIGAWWIVGHPTWTRTWSVAFGAVIVGTALVTLLLLGGERGLLKPLIGADNRVSTSKVQLALWTVAVGFALAFLTGRVLWEGSKFEVVLNDERLGEYLILIGGPFAAGVLAKLAVTWKVQNGSLQKVAAPEATIIQAVTDDAGNADLVDAQYLIFNFVALAYFVFALAQESVLPEMPAVLLGLTSAAAATYTANKAADQNAPVISAVAPTWCRPGQRIRVSGHNFLAGTDAKSAIGVIVLLEAYAGELRPTITSSGAELVVDLPPDLSPGPKQLTVQTAARVVSAPYTVQIVADKPILFGPKIATHAPGAQATILGDRLLSEGATTGSENVAVTVRDLTVAGIATADQVTFNVPPSIAPNTDVTVAVERAGVRSDPITIHVA
jgi:hypothetical protein